MLFTPQPEKREKKKNPVNEEGNKGFRFCTSLKRLYLWLPFYIIFDLGEVLCLYSDFFFFFYSDFLK